MIVKEIFCLTILGNVQHYEVADCLKYNLIPTLVDKEAILEMSKAMKSADNKTDQNGVSQVGLVDIKVDTGMSRNGCQADEVHDLVTVRSDTLRIQMCLKSLISCFDMMLIRIIILLLYFCNFAVL